MDVNMTPTEDVATALDAVTLPLSDFTAFLYESVDPIPNDVFDLLYKIINACALVISCTGIGTNLITMRTFGGIGLEDSMTISFFFLAACDFCNCIVVSASTLCDICNILVMEGLITLSAAPYIPFFYIACSRLIFAISAAIFKVYMAIQRCLCVVLPFRVRGLFTRFRTFTFLGISSGISTLWGVVYLCGHTVKTVTVPAYNITYPTIGRHAKLQVFVQYQEFIATVLYSSVNQIIALTCFIIMVVALKRSVRFRKSAATANILADSSNKVKSSNIADKFKEKSNSKERQVLIQVAFLTGIYCITAAPLVGQGLATVAVPGYSYNEAYHNLYMTIHGFAMIGEILNSAGNFFVYLKYNSKFKKYLLHLHTTEKE